METNRDGLARLTLSVGGEAVLVNGYADVRKIFSDARFSRDLVASGSPRFWSNEVYVHPDMLLNIDGARHARLRRTLVPVFGPRLLARCRDRLDAVALEQARRLATLPAPADLVTEYAFPLAARMLCELTGASEHFDGLLDWMVRTAQAPRDRDEEKVFVDACAVHAGQLLQVRPAVPPLDTLVALHDTDHALSDGELARIVTSLIVGHRTLARLLGAGLPVLLRNPDQYSAIAGEPGRLPAAVEEILRLGSRGGARPRVACADVELRAGTIRAGELVFPGVRFANRDPLVFERPDELDVLRDRNPHLSLGHSTHHCLAAHLVRHELRAALTAFVQVFPRAELQN